MSMQSFRASAKKVNPTGNERFFLNPTTANWSSADRINVCDGRIDVQNGGGFQMSKPGNFGMRKGGKMRIRNLRSYTTRRVV